MICYRIAHKKELHAYFRKTIWQILIRPLNQKVDNKLVWLPDWENPRSEIISNTVSNVFYPINAFTRKDGVLLKGKELGYQGHI